MLFVAVMLIGLVLGSYMHTAAAIDELNVMKIRQAEINTDLRYLREKIDEISSKLDRVTR